MQLQLFSLILTGEYPYGLNYPVRKGEWLDLLLRPKSFTRDLL